MVKPTRDIPKEPEQELVALEEYEAGLLNDFGGGNVDWWQDYIRAELGRAYEHYQSQITTPPQREWVGLTLADKEEFLAQDFGGNRLDAMDWAEKRLKEKNNGT